MTCGQSGLAGAGWNSVGLVAAQRVEDVGVGVGQVDGDEVALVVAPVARVAGVHGVEVGVAVGGGRRAQRRRALLVPRLEGGGHRPAAGRDLDAGGEGDLVDLAVEAVGVDVVADDRPATRSCSTGFDRC